MLTLQLISNQTQIKSLSKKQKRVLKLSPWKSCASTKELFSKKGWRKAGRHVHLEQSKNVALMWQWCPYLLQIDMYIGSTTFAIYNSRTSFFFFFMFSLCKKHYFTMLLLIARSKRHLDCQWFSLIHPPPPFFFSSWRSYIKLHRKWFLFFRTNIQFNKYHVHFFFDYNIIFVATKNCIAMSQSFQLYHIFIFFIFCNEQHLFSSFFITYSSFKSSIIIAVELETFYILKVF